MNLTEDQIQNIIELIDRDRQSIGHELRDYDAWISEELTSDYIGLVNEVPSFDWRNWKRGLDAIKSGSDFADFSAEELMKALFAIFRGNRFTEGLWGKYLLDGTISRILNRLKDEVSQQSSVK